MSYLEQLLRCQREMNAIMEANPLGDAYRRTLASEAQNYRAVLDGTWNLEPPKCECGVAIVGGRHSDWCPAKDID